MAMYRTFKLVHKNCTLDQRHSCWISQSLFDLYQGCTLEHKSVRLGVNLWPFHGISNVNKILRIIPGREKTCGISRAHQHNEKNFFRTTNHVFHSRANPQLKMQCTPFRTSWVLFSADIGLEK